MADDADPANVFSLMVRRENGKAELTSGGMSASAPSLADAAFILLLRLRPAGSLERVLRRLAEGK